MLEYYHMSIQDEEALEPSFLESRKGSGKLRNRARKYLPSLYQLHSRKSLIDIQARQYLDIDVIDTTLGKYLRILAHVRSSRLKLA